MMVKKLLVLCLILVSLLPVPAGAQQALTLPALQVELWPEFDQPEMLVIYHMTLPADLSLPARLTVRIPAAAGQPHALAARQPDGNLFTLPYEQQENGEWLAVSFEATSPEVQLEYYDPTLDKQGSARSFVYRWAGDYAVDALAVRVQQPTEAQGMQISPGMAAAERGQDGLLYYSSQIGAVPAGQQVEIKVSYQKDSDTLTSASVSVASSAPLSSAETRRSFWRSALPWVLGGLGLLLIAGGGVWYWQSGHQQEQRPARRGRRKASEASRPLGSASTKSGETDAVYCHQCGKRAGPGDRFCRVCGTQLKNQ